MDMIATEDLTHLQLRVGDSHLHRKDLSRITGS
jgi:hypothetical protein